MNIEKAEVKHYVYLKDKSRSASLGEDKKRARYQRVITIAGVGLS